MAQGYYQSSLYKKKCVNVSAMLCILNKILYIFKIIMCYVELTRGVVIFEWMGVSQTILGMKEKHAPRV